jgi:hypothetical protein
MSCTAVKLFQSLSTLWVTFLCSCWVFLRSFLLFPTCLPLRWPHDSMTSIGVSIMHTTQINRLRGYASEQPSWTSPLAPRLGHQRACTGISCDLTDWLLEHVSGTRSSLGLQLQCKTVLCHPQVNNVNRHEMPQAHRASLCTLVMRLGRSW